MNRDVRKNDWKMAARAAAFALLALLLASCSLAANPVPPTAGPQPLPSPVASTPTAGIPATGGTAAPAVSPTAGPGNAVSTATATGQPTVIIVTAVPPAAATAAANPPGPVVNSTLYPATSAGVPVTGANLYTVKAGDTLTAIADQFGLTLAALEAANQQIADPNLIQPGQVLNIPPLTPQPVLQSNTPSSRQNTVPATRILAPSATPVY
jgi:LysM repeat protein